MTAADRARRFSEDVRVQEEKQVRTFEWPCYKRKPHEPHMKDEARGDDRSCPGVSAHPATQIGGNYEAW